MKIKEIISFIGDGNTERAIKELRSKKDDFDRIKPIEITSISARFNKLNKDIINHLITYSEGQLQLNIINKSLVELLTLELRFELENDANSEETSLATINKLSNEYKLSSKIKINSSRLRVKNNLTNQIGEILIKNPELIYKLIQTNNQGIISGIAFKIRRVPSSNDLDFLEAISKQCNSNFSKGNVVNALAELVYSDLLRIGDDHRIKTILKRLQIDSDLPLSLNIKRVETAIIYSIQEDVPFLKEIPSKNKPSSIKRKILFLSASTVDTSHLKLSKELQDIKNSLQLSTQRDNFKLCLESAVHIPNMTKAMLRFNPEIIHFAGLSHDSEGIFIVNSEGYSSLFPREDLNKLFQLFRGEVKCVVLNACYSKKQAQIISKHGVYVIGINKDIDDKIAIKFSIDFYQNLGEGNDFMSAYKIAVINILVHLDDVKTPDIWLNGVLCNDIADPRY